MTGSSSAALFNKVTRRLNLREALGAMSTGAAIDTVAICMVRNEQDIIEPFLRHAAGLMDLVVVLDNMSSDATRKIMTATARELGNIIITDWPDHGYNQSLTMTAALRYIQSAVFADFVFFLDADEFLDVPDKATLLQRVSKLRPNNIGLLPWRTFLPDPAVTEADRPDPLDRLTLCRKEENPVYYKAVLRMAGGLDPDLRVTQGNHFIENTRGRKLRAKILEDLALFHFPLRSSDQLLAKGVINWEAQVKRVKLKGDSNDSYQWKRLHDIAERGERPSPDLLMQEALTYAQSEKPGPVEDHIVAGNHGLSITRRYSDGRSAPAEALIAAARNRDSTAVAPMPLPDLSDAPAAETNIENASDMAGQWQKPFLDEPPIRFVLERFAPASVLDVGCGIGFYPALCKHMGIGTVLGVDGLPQEGTLLEADAYQTVDLQHPLETGRTFDLVVCLEVAEHLDPGTTDILFDTIARHAEDTILFSMAEPGQPGNGHINCLSMAEVLDLWAKRGWAPDLPATLGTRAISSLAWFRRNLVVLRRDAGRGADHATDALTRIGALPFEWYGQSPGQRVAAFGEPYPAGADGYGRLRSGFLNVM